MKIGKWLLSAFFLCVVIGGAVYLMVQKGEQETLDTSTGESKRDGFVVSPVAPFDATEPKNVTELEDRISYSFVSQKNPDVSMNVFIERGGLIDIPMTEQKRSYRGLTLQVGFSEEEVVGTTYFEKEGFGYLIQTFGVVDGEKAAEETKQVIDGILEQLQVKE